MSELTQTTPTTIPGDVGCLTGESALGRLPIHADADSTVVHVLVKKLVPRADEKRSWPRAGAPAHEM